MPHRTKPEESLRTFDPRRVGDGTSRVKFTVTCEEPYTDVVEWRRALWRLGISPARFLGWFIRQISLQDPEIVALVDRIREDRQEQHQDLSQTMVRGGPQGVTHSAEELYSLIEFALEDSKATVLGDGSRR